MATIATLRAGVRGLTAFARQRSSLGFGALTLFVAVSWKSIGPLPGYIRGVTRVGKGLSSLSFINSTSPPAMPLKPPQAIPRWTHSADEVIGLTDDAIKKHREQLDKIAKLPAEDCNFNSVRISQIAHVLT
jgi:hypothetical protein